MIVVGILGMETQYHSFEMSMGPVLLMLSKAVLVIFGIVIIIDPSKTNMKAIGMYAIAMGTGRALRAMISIPSPSDVIFMFGMVMLILGASLALCGVSYMQGVSKNASRMKIISSVIVIGYVGALLFVLHWGYEVEYIIGSQRDLISMVAMFAVLVCVLSTKEVHDNIPEERMLLDLQTVSGHANRGNRVQISAEDLDALRDGLTDARSWAAPDYDGPVESETCVKLVSENGTKCAILQRWSGMEGIFLNLADDAGGSFINGYRSRIMSMRPMEGTWDDCNAVELIDTEGNATILHVIRRKILGR